MNKWLDGFGILWIICGLLVGAVGVLFSLNGNFANIFLGILGAFVCFTTGMILMGFAVIVRYFEGAIRKQRHGDKRG